MPQVIMRYFMITAGLLSLSTFLFSIQGCDADCLAHEGRSEFRRLDEIRESSNSRLVASFNDYPVDKRIDIFLYAERCAHDSRFEPILSRGGRDLIPAIVSRIEREPRVRDKNSLIDVLIRINNDCNCIARDSPTFHGLESILESLDRGPKTEADASYIEIYRTKLEVLGRSIK